MGLRGPKPEPTAIKLAKGNPGKRTINPYEPQPGTGIPRCPSWLADDAKKCWYRMVPLLREMGVLTRADTDALTVYCETWARWRRAVEFLEKNGDVYTLKDDNGDPKCVVQWPQVAIARNLIGVLNRFQAEFGLTPSARTRIDVAACGGNFDLGDAIERAISAGLEVAES